MPIDAIGGDQTFGGGLRGARTVDAGASPRAMAVTVAPPMKHAAVGDLGHRKLGAIRHGTA
jgi:hypothetical protein